MSNDCQPHDQLGSYGEAPRTDPGDLALAVGVTDLSDPNEGTFEFPPEPRTTADAVRFWSRVRIYARIFGTETVVNNRATFIAARPHANADDATRTAHQARAEIEALRALTPAQAIARIEQTRAAEQAAREAAVRALNERQRQLRSALPSHNIDPHREGPSLGR